MPLQEKVTSLTNSMLDVPYAAETETKENKIERPRNDKRVKCIYIGVMHQEYTHTHTYDVHNKYF